MKWPSALKMKMKGYQILRNFSFMSYLRKVIFLVLYEGHFVSTKLSMRVFIRTFNSVAGSNPIYNLLPDILSKLSSQDLAGESFCNIMQFLIGSIKKVSLVQSCLVTAVIVFVLDLFNDYGFCSGQTNGISC